MEPNIHTHLGLAGRRLWKPGVSMVMAEPMPSSSAPCMAQMPYHMGVPVLSGDFWKGISHHVTLTPNDLMSTVGTLRVPRCLCFGRGLDPSAPHPPG